MNQNVVDLCIEDMRRSEAFRHPFLVSLQQGPMDSSGARRFAVQWFKAATAHKKAFPGLVYNTDDDRIRIQLIEILREEYGYGDENRIHARILQHFLRGLGLDIESLGGIAAVAEVEAFSREVDEAWTRGDPIEAFGVHFALEFLAANMHRAFYAGVQTLGRPADEIEYFAIHSVAEEDHWKLAEQGFRYLADTPSNTDALNRGVQEGTRMVRMLLDGLKKAYDS